MYVESAPREMQPALHFFEVQYQIFTFQHSLGMNILNHRCAGSPVAAGEMVNYNAAKYHNSYLNCKFQNEGKVFFNFATQVQECETTYVCTSRYL